MSQGLAIHKLPAEVALQILTSCSDLSSLYGLAQCVPFWSVFKTYAAEAVAAVLNREVPAEVRVMMRGVLGLQTMQPMLHTLEEAQAYPNYLPYSAANSSNSSNFSVSSSSDESDEDANSSSPSTHAHPFFSSRRPAILTRIVKESNDRASLRARALQVWPPLPLAFPANQPSSAIVLMRFLSLIHNIHCLAHGCLKLCLDKLQLALPATDSRLQLEDALRPPSWLEEQRALFGLWRLQFFCELQRSRRNNRLLWPFDDLAELERQTPRQFEIGGYQCDLVMTMMQCLEELIPTSIAAAQVTGQLPTLSGNICHSLLCADNPFPKNLLLGNYKEEQFRTKGQDHMGGIDFRDSRRPLETHSPQWREDYNPSDRRLEFCHIRLPALGWELCGTWMLDAAAGLCKVVSFEPFAKFGFTLWEQKRVVALDLWSSEGNERLAQHQRQWLSLLTPDEVEKYTYDRNYSLPDDRRINSCTRGGGWRDESD